MSTGMSATKAKSPRPRCACGRARRIAASACQKCLDIEDAARRAREPKRMWSRDWRAAGWLCAIFGGRVYIAHRDATTGAIANPRFTSIDGGRWAERVDATSEDWTMLADIAIYQRLKLISRDCYCTSFPATGCDFCNGTRLPDGAKEI